MIFSNIWNVLYLIGVGVIGDTDPKFCVNVNRILLPIQNLSPFPTLLAVPLRQPGSQGNCDCHRNRVANGYFLICRSNTLILLKDSVLAFQLLSDFYDLISIKFCAADSFDFFNNFNAAFSAYADTRACRNDVFKAWIA